MSPSLAAIERYAEYWLHAAPLKDFNHTSPQREQGSVKKIRAALAEGAIAFDRGGRDGHFTASAAIVDPAAEKTLLHHHRKLGIWVQLGGHCDGETDFVATSKREALEESGLTELNLWQPEALLPLGALPLDIDIHSIPGPSGHHDHYHFDIRYLWLADARKPLTISEESLDLAWVPFTELASKGCDASVRVLIEKSQYWLNLAATAPEPQR